MPGPVYRPSRAAACLDRRRPCLQRANARVGHHGMPFPRDGRTDPFVIDQNVPVGFTGRSEPWVQALLSGLRGTLDGFGGIAGILRDQAPSPLNARQGVDAVIISADDTLV